MGLEILHLFYETRWLFCIEVTPRVRDKLIVDIYFFRDDLNSLSRQSNDSFNEVLRWVFRINKYDNITSVRAFIR